MAGTFTDAQNDWVASVFHVDPRTYEGDGAPPPAAAANGANGAEANGAGANGAEPDGGGRLKEFFKKFHRGAKRAVAEVERDVGKAVDAVEDGVAPVFTGAPPAKPATVGPAQKNRADKLLAAMPPEDKAKVQKILDDAPAVEKGYLEKAVASKHSAAEIETFQKAIAGKNAAWLEKNLHLVGQSHGKGIKQQWHDSCGPTTIQAMKGELDPIYALKIRTENPNFKDADDADAELLNPGVAAEQKAILEKNGGVAVNRDNEDDGKGMGLNGALNDQSGVTGLKFSIEEVDPNNMDASLAEVDSSIKSGLPVPMRVSSDSVSGGHFVLVVGEDDGPPKTYSIHDPWDGKIVKVTDKQMKDQDFNIANWNKVSHIYKPSPDPAATPGS